MRRYVMPTLDVSYDEAAKKGRLMGWKITRRAGPASAKSGCDCNSFFNEEH